jgi:hypothetical protein
MYSSDKKIMPPLRLWLLLVVVMIFAALLLKRITDINKEKDFAYRTSYLLKQLSNAKEKTVILFLGTSLTKCDLDSSIKIESAIKNESGKDVAIIKIWREGTSIKTITEAMPALQNIHPPLLIVEANMLCYKIKGEGFATEIPATLNKLLRFKKHLPYAPEEKPTHRFTEDIIGKNRTGIVDTSELKSFRELAEKLQANGTRIILINYPYEKKEEYKKWSSADTTLFKRNFKYIQQKVNFKYFDPKKNWDSSYYSDGGHMNYKGCLSFTKWICTTLSAELKNYGN